MTHILVTNDDGVESEGIKALAESLRAVKGVTVTVVAPDRERSTVSHSLTLHKPLRVKQMSDAVYAVDGTPTDAVFLGVSALHEKKPDYIFSGINRGGNLGDDVHYSGTVSAAVEGAIMGIPSVAISQLGLNKFDFSMAAKFAQKILQMILKNPLPPEIVLNVNVPENAQTLDYEIVKTGKRDYGTLHEKREDPRGKTYYWIGGNQYNFCDVPHSDCNTIVSGKISVTPLAINLTNHEFMNKMKTWK